MPDIITTNMDVDIDHSASTPDTEVYTGKGDGVMDVLKTRPIRNSLPTLLYPGFVADYTVAQFVEIADIKTTNMDIDFDLPAGASGAWGALEIKTGEIAPGTIHWSFDQFATKLKSKAINKIEYISGSGLPPYVVLSANDPGAGGAGRDKEDFRFYDLEGDLRVDELALPNQWNEINLGIEAGCSGGGLEVLTVTLIQK